LGRIIKPYSIKKLITLNTLILVTGVEAKAKARPIRGQGQGRDFLSSSRPRGRGQSSRTPSLHKRECQTSLRANVLGFRIVNFWNSMPEDTGIVSAPSVDNFKGRFDKHFAHLRYCTE